MMSLRWLFSAHASWICWLCGHADAVHEVTQHGGCWICPDCRRWHRSALPVRRTRRNEVA